MIVSAGLVSYLEFNVPFQHKYGYIRDDVSAGYGIPVGQPAAAMTSRPSQPASARGAPVSGTPGRTYVGFTSPGNTSHTLLAYSLTYLLNYCVRISSGKQVFYGLLSL